MLPRRRGGRATVPAFFPVLWRLSLVHVAEAVAKGSPFNCLPSRRHGRDIADRVGDNDPIPPQPLDDKPQSAVIPATRDGGFVAETDTIAVVVRQVQSRHTPSMGGGHSAARSFCARATSCCARVPLTRITLPIAK